MLTDQKKLPLVSVIIPTFNREYLISQTLESVLAQSYKNIEILVIDDGSTDNTKMVVGEIAQKYSNIKYLSKVNGGCASARNKGLGIAKGDYIAFLDSDDKWLSNAIESLTKCLLESKVDFVYSPSIEVYPDGREEINYPSSFKEPEKLAKAHFMNTNIRNGTYIFSRSSLEKVGWLDESLKFNEDSDFVQRLSIHCKVGYFPSPVIRVFNHQNSKSRNRVEIYRALLKSSEKNLLQNPDFAAELGVDAKKRILQIKSQLVEALVINGNYNEAESISTSISDRINLNVRLAILIRSNQLLKFGYLIRGSMSKIKHRLRKMY